MGRAYPQCNGALGNRSSREIASFLANINVESAGLTVLTENLNYSTEALISKFGRHRISIADAKKYGRNASHPANQEMIANILYGGEFGSKNLGNTEPTDGWIAGGWDQSRTLAVVISKHLPMLWG